MPKGKPESFFFRFMKTSDFSFDLPKNLIAQYPSKERGQSRLLVMNRAKGLIQHRMLGDLPLILEKGTLMVFNNSRVRRARLLGQSMETGAKAEFLLLNKVDGSPLVWKAMAQRAKRRRPGSRYTFPGGLEAQIIAAEGEYRFLEFTEAVDDGWLDIHGHVPLPEYIKRADTDFDAERYQTIYAAEHGSAAAPTAGIHFTRELLAALEKAGMETVFITLHVGLGTFLPVRSENLEDHKMHEESFSLSEDAASRIEKAKKEGRKILAVGTTSVRTLESAWQEDSGNPGGGRFKRGEWKTSIFIYPGYAFKTVDMLFTNFHTPGSTLLMLVCAFAGRDFILETYKEAVREGYRFYSYGDACLIQ